MHSTTSRPARSTVSGDFDRSPKPHVQRFHRLDAAHIQALEFAFSRYSFLQGRMEVHLPAHKAKHTFQNDAVWVWPKFDRRPANYLVFLDGFAPCVWDPSRQEGFTLRWILPPNFSSRGPTIFLANLLKGESVLQIEDVLVANGRELWTHVKFSERWEELRRIWSNMPPDQPLLAFQPRVVQPVPLSEWADVYDASLSWIIQPDCVRSPRWFWWDSVTPNDKAQFVAPALKREAEVKVSVAAICRPYSKVNLPDTYSLYSQEDRLIGIASIRSLTLSRSLREAITDKGIPVEVEWNREFEKYQITCILPEGTSASAFSFFPYATSA